jgi:peroxin-6
MRSLFNSVEAAPDVSVDDLAMQTAALVSSDLVDLVARGQYAHVKAATSSK